MDLHRFLGPICLKLSNIKISIFDSARLCMISQIIVIMFMINHIHNCKACQSFVAKISFYLSDSDVAFFCFFIKVRLT